jgi:hypothetical protein
VDNTWLLASKTQLTGNCVEEHLPANKMPKGILDDWDLAGAFIKPAGREREIPEMAVTYR